MSKYTTEVRNYCESVAGYSDRQGFDNIEEVLSAENLAKIMRGIDYPIFDESYRNTLNKKILLHYYTREIGFETVGLWKLKLKTRMGEIMPYYNQMYASELIKFNPLYDIDLQKSSTRAGNESGNNQSNKKATGTSTSENTFEGTNKNLTQSAGSNNSENTRNSTDTRAIDSTSDNLILNNDTPQGGVDGFDLDSTGKQYLTSAEKTTTRKNDTNSGTANGNEKANSNYTDSVTGDSKRSDKENAVYDFTNNEDKTDSHDITTLENYIEKVQGKSGSDSYSSKLIEFRKTFLNIDMMIIDELADLFMTIW